MANGILDYFMVSPGDRKRAELDVQNKIRLQQALSDIEKNRAIALRDSNQLNADFQRGKQEREMQETLGRMFPVPKMEGLTDEENALRNTIHASSRMDEMRAAKPLADTAANMQAFEQKEATRPFNAELGATSALSGIAGNEAGAALGLLNKAVNLARRETAPAAAQSGDIANIAETINAYNEAQARDTTIPARTQAVASSAFADAAKGNFEQPFWNARNAAKAAEAANAADLQNITLQEWLAKRPEFSSQVSFPNPRTALMMQMFGNGGGAFSGDRNGPPSSAFGGLNPAVGPKKKGNINQ